MAIDYCRSGTDRDGFEKRYISDHIGKSKIIGVVLTPNL